jgi:hypothetical protein
VVKDQRATNIPKEIKKFMYEFVAVLCGRNVMVEGQQTRIALINGLISVILMQLVATWFGEDVYVYYFVLLKYMISWLLVGGLFGCFVVVATFGRFRPDPYPKTRAWPNGPYLNPILRVSREFCCAFVSLFVPLNDHGMDILMQMYNNSFGLVAGFIIFTIMYYMEDSRRMK